MNKLPVPQTVSGWFFSAILIFASFLWYYNGGIFDKFSEHYYGDSVLPKIAAEQEDYDVTVQIPKTISRFVARDLIVTVTAKNDIDNIRILISEKNSLVLFCSRTPSLFTGCDESQNYLDFDSLKAGEQKTRTLGVIVAPRVLLKGTLNAKYVLESGGEVLNFGAGAITESAIENTGSFKSSFLSTLLLPPWANGFIPALVLFVVYLFEHKIQPGQKFRV